MGHCWGEHAFKFKDRHVKRGATVWQLQSQHHVPASHGCPWPMLQTAPELGLCSAWTKTLVKSSSQPRAMAGRVASVRGVTTLERLGFTPQSVVSRFHELRNTRVFCTPPRAPTQTPHTFLDFHMQARFNIL